MPMTRQEVIRLIYPRFDPLDEDDERVRGRRFTQDTPVLPDVWIAYATGGPDQQKDLLLTPNSACGIEELVFWLRKRLAIEGGPDPGLIYNESHVRAKLTLRQLIRAALPLSEWWRTYIQRAELDLGVLDRLSKRKNLQQLLMDPAALDKKGDKALTEDVLNMVRIVGAVALGEPPGEVPSTEYLKRSLRKLGEFLSDLPVGESMPPADRPYPLWSVFRNRQARSAIARSRLAVKADAAVRLFEITCDGIRWGIIDSGIDARHPAFLKRPAVDPRAGRGDDCPPKTADPLTRSRIARTYDFTRLAKLLASPFLNSEDFNPALKGKEMEGIGLDEDELREIHRDIQPRLQSGRLLDWKLLAKLLQIPHNGKYEPPKNEHGTHVAGILAADWRRDAASADPQPEDNLIGMCPDLELYDLRVFDADGRGDEFAILAALQFVRWLNASKDKMVIQGVNLSFSLPHAVDSFACGSTPVCEEASRLWASGVVVVAAAGNRGYEGGENTFGIYRSSSITDPGNAEDVITVGATHRYMPHKYGVSYFSSRGPTGDGRRKPDLVAPGEKIVSTTPDNKWVRLDGTSMAAPHVSGAAALLMARHRELIGNPARVKEILCATATDLRRDRDFQGAGMLDVLRALQSV